MLQTALRVAPVGGTFCKSCECCPSRGPQTGFEPCFRADPEFLYDEEVEAPVASLSWHPSGSHLAVLPRGHAFAMVWSAATREMARVDGGVKVRGSQQYPP